MHLTEEGYGKYLIPHMYHRRGFVQDATDDYINALPWLASTSYIHICKVEAVRTASVILSSFHINESDVTFA